MNRLRSCAGTLLLLLGVSSSVSAQAPGIVYDEGFVEFRLANNDTAVDGVRVDEGWGLIATARIVGTVPRRSAFIFKISQNGTELGQMRCTLESERNHVIAEWHGVSDCKDRQQRITVAGDVEVAVILVDGDTDVETVVANHRIQVMHISRVRGGGRPTSQQHYINHNGEVLRGIIGRIPKNTYGYTSGRDGSRNRVELHAIAAPSEYNRPDQGALSMTDPRELSMRCTVDGQRITIDSDQVSGSMDNIEVAIHVGGNGSREDRIVAHYRWIHYILPIEWGEFQTGGRAVLDEHPGRWECQLRNSGQVVRSFGFTVNADATIAPHPEEAAGLTLGLGAHFVDMVIPDSETFETRVDPDSVRRMGIGYGHVLTSAPSVANVAALPTLGEAFLPQPAPARTRRGRRGRGRR